MKRGDKELRGLAERRREARRGDERGEEKRGEERRGEERRGKHVFQRMRHRRRLRVTRRLRAPKAIRQCPTGPAADRVLVLVVILEFHRSISRAQSFHTQTTAAAILH